MLEALIRIAKRIIQWRSAKMGYVKVKIETSTTPNWKPKGNFSPTQA
jgi:argininosuccinate lyase